MAQRKKIMVVLGTRPEAIKMAPVIHVLRSRPECWDVEVAVTAQHREMLDQALGLFQIQPDHDLRIMRPGQNLFDVTTKALTGLDRVLQTACPDMVLVHGDTTTTFVGALASFYHRIPVAHVEAGLRTGQRYSPYPEEVNRRLAGQLCELHFAPTQSAADNLLAEGIDPRSIVVTGNTVIDALWYVKNNTNCPTQIGADWLADGKKLVLVTAHRRESFGQPMEQVFQILRILAQKNANVRFVYPVHPNPNVREMARRILDGIDNFHLTEPLSYRAFVHVMSQAHLILTDSGGVQEEAPSLGVPVLVLREVTERPEAVQAGTVRLVGTDAQVIMQESERLLHDREYHRIMASAQNPYGDGFAAKRIESMLAHVLLGENRPTDFVPASSSLIKNEDRLDETQLESTL